MNMAVRPNRWSGPRWTGAAARHRAVMHGMLWTCYLSGQMSDDDLEREIGRDPLFGEFVAAMQRRSG